MYQVLKKMLALDIDSYETGEAEHDALLAAIEDARVAVAVVEGKADQ